MKYAFLVFSFITQLAGSGQLLIRNVNVLDVENKKVLNGHDVLIMDGKISSIHNDKMYKLPGGTEVIDGTGKWLSPGLTDAHVHFFQTGGLYTRPDAIDLRKYQPHDKEIKFAHDNMEALLRRYASAGITSVIDAGASFNFLLQRDSMVLRPASPVISMTGPLLTTWLPQPYNDMGH